MNSRKLRIGQVEAIRIVTERVTAGEKFTAIVLPTRYGKTDVIRITATELRRDGKIACTLMLSPNAYLRDQAARIDKWNEALGRYEINRKGLNVGRLLDVRHPYKDGRVTMTPNDEMFLSATIQLLTKNLEIFCAWVSSVRLTTGIPVMIAVDESHMGGEDLSWGDAVKALADAGAVVVLYTATAQRSDGRKIPGFDTVEESAEDVVITKIRPGSLPELIKVSIYDGRKTVLKLKAHHETSFEDAWAEKPSPLCRITRVNFDADLTEIFDGIPQGTKMLSDLKPAEVRKYLGKLVREPRFIEEGVRRFLTVLGNLRKISGDIAGIIFCGNDKDSNAAVNRHCEEVKLCIRSMEPQLNCIIATSADEQGRDLIEEFANGRGDILIVKQMASLGLDVPRLKVILDLSPVRTMAASIQRLMRIATLFGLFREGTAVLPEDILWKANFDAMVVSMGGSSMVADLELREEYETERGEGEPGTEWLLNQVNLGPFGDTDGNEAAAVKMAFVEAILEDFPELAAFRSLPIIASYADKYAIVGDRVTSDHVHDPGIRATILRKQIAECAEKIIATFMAPHEYSSELYGRISREVYVEAYKAAGVPSGARLGDIHDIELLEKINTAMERHWQQAGRYA